MLKTLTYHILLYLQILVNEIRPILQIGHYSSDMGCCQNYYIRMFFIEKVLHGFPIQQIQIVMILPYQIGISPV